MERKHLNIIFILIMIIVIGVLIYFVAPVSVPLILAFLTAAVFDPFVRWCLKTFNLKRSWTVFMTFLIYLGMLGLISFIFIKKGATQVIRIIDRIPSYTVNFINHWEDLSVRIIQASEDLPLPLILEINNQLDGLLFSVTEPLRNFDYLKLVTMLGTWIPLFMVSVIVYLIAVFLFMLELPNIRISFYSHLKDETAEKVHFMNKRLASVVKGFIKAQFLISLIIFTVSYIALLIISPKLALIMALVIWFIDFIPIIGSIAIVAPWALLELIQGNLYESTSLAILAIILLVIRRTVEPKVMGQYIGLSPLPTLISMFLGVKLIGITGFIIGPLLLIAFNTARESGLIKMNFKI